MTSLLLIGLWWTPCLGFALWIFRIGRRIGPEQLRQDRLRHETTHGLSSIPGTYIRDRDPWVEFVKECHRRQEAEAKAKADQEFQ